MSTFSFDWTNLDGDFAYPDGMSIDTTELPSGVTASGSLRWPDGVGDNAYIPVDLTLTLSEDGTVSFWVHTVSEQEYDGLKFYIDGNEQSFYSANPYPWELVSFPVIAGVHTFTWAYTSDGSYSEPINTAWIALLEVTGILSPIPPLPSAVDVTFSIAGSTVTSVDTGLPVDAYSSDGTQNDPATNSPYPIGMPLVNDSDGHPQPVVTNLSDSPMITVNSTQTWVVKETILIRNSLIFNRPTVFGRFHQAIGWVPVDEIVEEWGKIQIIIDGRDVTYFRAHPSELGPWSSNEPNGDVATSVFFPQISWLEPRGVGELAWIDGGNDIDILLIRPNGTRKVLFEGLVVGVALSGQGNGVTVNCIGCLYQADHNPYIQELYQKHRDIGTAIADVMDNAISRHYLPCNRPLTGIGTNIRGSGGARLTQSVQDMLATAFTPDATNQWTITNMPGRKPTVKIKDKTTHHWVMAVGHPGLSLSLTDDFQQSVGMVWGSGISPNGGSWFNAKYPGIRIDDIPPYPLAVGAVFVAGDGHTGFDILADMMRTRGYHMVSKDTYSRSDVDEIKDAQRRAGITVDGVVGAQTWTGIFGVGGSTPSLDGAHIAPLAAITENVQYLERPDGSIIGPNPKYDKSKLAIGRLVEYGDVAKVDGSKFARGEIQARIDNDPLWVGSATLTMDPENDSRWEMRAGENLFVKYIVPAPKRKGKDDGLLLHMSQAAITPGGSVTVQLSYLGHDMTTLAAIMKRNKDTLDPARRGANNRTSKMTQDSIIPWDEEAGGGKIPMHNLQGGFWIVFRIAGGQLGIISKTMYVCATTVTPSTIGKAFSSESALGGAREFCVAIFSKPVTANFLKGTVGNPLSASGVWTSKAAQLEKAGLLQAYGASDQPGGHWPGAGSEGAALTGKLLDGSTWPWKSSSPPYLWIAEYCESSTKIAGQLLNAPLGS
jgi:peptidoglycan hydrolase-like protein with peptidoglycan-binding domain